jgi:hypothetical protein
VLQVDAVFGHSGFVWLLQTDVDQRSWMFLVILVLSQVSVMSCYKSKNPTFILQFIINQLLHRYVALKHEKKLCTVGTIKQSNKYIDKTCQQ